MALVFSKNLNFLKAVFHVLSMLENDGLKNFWILITDQTMRP